MSPYLQFDPDLPGSRNLDHSQIGIYQAMEFEKLRASRKDMGVVSAEEIFEGRAFGDALYLVSTEGLLWGTHPFREIYDICINDDNGDVVFDTAGGLVFVPPSCILMAQWPETGCPPRKRLPAKAELPSTVSIDHDTELVRDPLSHHLGGQILVLEQHGKHPSHLLAWRWDARQKKDLVVISGHNSEEFAKARMLSALETFDPSRFSHKKPTRRSNPDIQRQKVYDFETRIGFESKHKYRWLDTFEDCHAYLTSVYETLGRTDVPEIRMGRENLTASYFRLLDGITLSRHGKNEWTILHEASHHIARKMTSTEPGHGPVFAGVLSGMLERFFDIDREIIDRCAADKGVERNLEARDAILESGMEPAIRFG